jgi:diguanylate cyclase (GGDEF)-like protein
MMIHRDGMEFAIEDSAAPIHDRGGQVAGAVIVFHDVSATRALSKEMTYLAQHDSLTGLPNRVLFSDRLAEAIAMAKRHGRRLAVLFVDIDRFKNVNDSLGHIVGDRILKSVATRLTDCVRNSDTVCRQGGDEFVILLSEIARPIDAAGSAEKVLRAVEIPELIDDVDVHISASIGIATFPEDGKDAEELISSADFAMYSAKEKGRNNYQFFKLEMHNRAAERRSTEHGLRDALREHRLELYYQPEVRLDSGAITGVEALIRWHHPKRGTVLPGEFIATAEESGLIVPIGRWAIAEACRQAGSWKDMGFVPIRVAVNVSAVELRAKDFVKDVRAIIIEAGMSPDALELELTETFMMQDPKSTALVLGSLKDVGVKLALDDFGTGYSSLSYLQRFPIDTLKIDRSFIRDVDVDESNATIVNAVIGMGQSMHKRVVAEGVETKEQVGFLHKQGCLEGQGFYYTPPRSAEQITRFLRRSVAVRNNRMADQSLCEAVRG